LELADTITTLETNPTNLIQREKPYKPYSNNCNYLVGLLTSSANLGIQSFAFYAR